MRGRQARRRGTRIGASGLNGIRFPSKIVRSGRLQEALMKNEEKSLKQMTPRTATAMPTITAYARISPDSCRAACSHNRNQFLS